MRPAVVALLGAFLLSGCLASKGDVALLQSELHGIRDANQQADATQRARVDLLVSMIQRSLDSVRVVSQRLAKLQGDVQNDHYEMGPLNHRRSEEHTSELQSHSDLVCRLLLETKKTSTTQL